MNYEIDKMELKELYKLLKIKSISTKEGNPKDIEQCANYLFEQLSTIGLANVKVFSDFGNPILFGEYMIDSNLPTILLYSHYDVQPPGDPTLWESDPFEPCIKTTTIHPAGAIFARGTSDDKCQLFMQIQAVKSLIQSSQLNCNLKFLIEGEEEIGSTGLFSFSEEQKELLSCDLVLICDTPITSMERPTLPIGLRGFYLADIIVESANSDLHSGLYGGLVGNPIFALSRILSTLFDESGKISLANFYEDIVEFSTGVRTDMNQAPFDAIEIKERFKIEEFIGEESYTLQERGSIRPSFEIHTFKGGYLEEGIKTIIPNKARATISFRLVPGQDPSVVEESLRKHIQLHCPIFAKATLHAKFLSPASLCTSTKSSGYIAAKQAFHSVVGRKLHPQFCGGGLPIVNLFESTFKAECILLGFGLLTDGAHAPNEHFGLVNYVEGKEVIKAFILNYGKIF